MTIIRFVYYVMFLLIGLAPSFSADYKLTKIEKGQSVDIDLKLFIDRNKYKNSVIFHDQSFSIKFRGLTAGNIYFGRGLRKGGERSDISTCFVAYKPASGALTFINTVGDGEWEAVSCLGVIAVGLIENPFNANLRIGAIHSAATQNAVSRPAVVFNLHDNNTAIAIDLPSVKLSEQKNVTTIPELRRLLTR